MYAVCIVNQSKGNIISHINARRKCDWKIIIMEWVHNLTTEQDSTAFFERRYEYSYASKRMRDAASPSPPSVRQHLSTFQPRISKVLCLKYTKFLNESGSQGKSFGTFYGNKVHKLLWLFQYPFTYQFTHLQHSLVCFEMTSISINPKNYSLIFSNKHYHENYINDVNELFSLASHRKYFTRFFGP